MSMYAVVVMTRPAGSPAYQRPGGSSTTCPAARSTSPVSCLSVVVPEFTIITLVASTATRPVEAEWSTRFTVSGKGLTRAPRACARASGDAGIASTHRVLTFDESSEAEDVVPEELHGRFLRDVPILTEKGG